MEKKGSKRKKKRLVTEGGEFMGISAAWFIYFYSLLSLSPSPLSKHLGLPDQRLH